MEVIIDNPISEIFRKSIKKLDFFDSTINFRIKKKEQFKTFLGGLSSLLFLTYLFNFVLVSLYQFFSETEFNIRFYADLNKDNNYTISNENNLFFYSLLIVDANNTSILKTDDHKNFIITQSHVKKYNNGTKKRVFLNSKNCQELHNKSLIPEFFIKNLNSDLTDFYCFDRDNFTIKGNYNSDYMEYLEILIKFNRTNFSYKNETVDLHFINKGYKASLYFFDNELNVKEGNLNQLLNSIYSYLDPSYFPTNDIFFSNFISERDTNLLYKKYNKTMFTKYDRSEIIYKNNEAFYMDDYKIFSVARFVFRVETNLYILSVSYNKLPLLLSNVFAFSKSILMVINFVISQYKEFKAKQSIFFRVFKYKDLFYLKFPEFKQKFEEIKKNKNNQDNSKIYGINKTGKTNDIDDEKFNNLENGTAKGENSKNNICSKLILKNGLQKKEIKLLPDEINNNLNIQMNIFEKSISDCKNSERSQTKQNKQIVKEENYYSNQPNISSFIESGIENQKKLSLPFISDDFLSIEGNINKKNYRKTLEFLKPEDKIVLDMIDNEMLDKLKNKIKYNLNPHKINPLVINLLDLILGKVLCKRPSIIKRKNFLYCEAEKKFDHNLDLVTYMKKFNEIDVIEEILFSKENKIIFDYISRPVIAYKNIDENEFASELKNDIFKNEFLMNNMFAYASLKEKIEKFDDREENLDFEKINIEMMKLLKDYFDKENENLLS